MDKGGSSRNTWEYVDFELEIGEGGPREYPVSIRSPAGEARAEMRFPFDEWELKDRMQSLEIALLRSGGTRRRIPSPEEHTVQDFGRGLFESLLVGDVRTRYEMSLSEARRQGKGLRLKLRIQPSELAVLPWEFLYDADRDRYPSLSSNTPLVRYLDLPQPVEPLRVSPPLRVLGMVTSPLGLDPLDVEHEKRLVEEAIKGLREGGLLEITWLEGQTWRHLMRAMRRGPWHVFHFVGHGGFDPTTEEGALALSDEAGHKRLLRATSLAELLDDHYPLRLVLLNSCEGARGSESDAFSSTAATLVRRGTPAVVAMQYEITDKAAIEFSRDFYEAVADSLPVDAAVTEARAAVSMDSALEWGTPVLYMHSPDGRVFDVAAPERGDQEEEDPARTYREAVAAAWAGGNLAAEVGQRLRDLADKGLAPSPETAAGIEREVMGETIEEILARQEEAARQERRGRRLAQLYAEAGRLHRDRNWQAVKELFEEIHAEDPGHPDPEGLLASSKDALEQQSVDALYGRGLQRMEAEEYEEALESFEEVQRLQPGYRDTEEYLSRARRALSPPSTVEVPDVTGLEVSRARRILSGRRLTIGSQRRVTSENMAAGQIVGQYPEAGTEVIAGSMIDIAVGSGAHGTTDTTEGGTGERALLVGRVRPPLPVSVGSWWALVLRGLLVGIFALALSQEFRLYGALMVLADGSVATIDAATRAGRSRSLMIQGRITILIGSLVLLVWLVRDILSSEPALVSDLSNLIANLAVAPRLVAAWAILIGILRTMAAVRLRSDPASFWLMGASGVSLAVFGVPLLLTSGQYPWVLLGLLALVSGSTLIAVALRARLG